MKTVASFIVGLMATTASLSVTAQTSETNHEDRILPRIDFNEVPISHAIENLGRMAGINCIIDPKLFHPVEPVINLHLQNASAKDALNRMLNLRNLVLIPDSVTQISRITRIGAPTNTVDPTLFQSGTNNAFFTTNFVLPIIEFQDVPLNSALDNLNRVAENKASFAPNMEKWFDSMPTLNVYWTNVTPMQALIAICRNYDLTIVKSSADGIIQIKPPPVQESQ
jgi:hypothetical protein